MTNKEILRSLYEELINNGKLDQIPRLFAEGHVGIHGVGVHGEVRPADFCAALAGIRAAFPDIHYLVEDLVEDGDRVAIRWKWSGTYNAPFRGFPANGKQVSDSGIAIYQFESGKIVNAWLQTNRLGFWQQIGVIPSEIVPRPQPAQQ